MNNPYIVIKNIYNTHGTVEVERGEVVDVKPSANPGMVRIETDGAMPYEALIPAEWVVPA